MYTEVSTPDPAVVARAMAMAAHLPTAENAQLRVQVLDRHGYLLASGVLLGLEQAAFLRDSLRPVGTFHLVPPALARERGCDVMLVEAYLGHENDGADFLRVVDYRR
jgi:hypothetical protein